MSFTRSLAARLAEAGPATAQVRLHEPRTVHWTIDVDAQGALLGVIPHPKAEKGHTPYQVLAPITAKNRASSTYPLLITDNAQYVLGVEKDGGKGSAPGKRQAWLALLAQAQHLPGVAAVLQAAQSLTPTDFPEQVTADQLLTFRVAGQPLHLHPDTQAWWIDHVEQSRQGSANDITDASTQERGPAAYNSPSISGIPGGMATVVWQTTYADTMRPYGLTSLGLTQGTIEKVASHLARLARDPATSHQPKGCPFRLLHWLSGAAPDPWTSLTEPTQENVHAILTASEPAGGEEVTVNLATVQGNSSRLMVLDHAELPLHKAAQHVTRYLRLTEQLPLMTAELALSTPDGKGVIPRHVAALHRFALLGIPLPRTIQADLVGRWRNDLKLTRPQLKLPVLTFPEAERMQDPSTVPEDLRNAYTLGRYAQIAHQVHRRANPSTQITVTDRFLRLLSSQPLAAFGQMERHLQAVLQGLRYSRPGLEVHLGQEIAAVTQHLSLPLPTRLSIEEQAALALGFEHERQRALDAARRRQAERELKATRTPDTTPTATKGV